MTPTIPSTAAGIGDPGSSGTSRDRLWGVGLIWTSEAGVTAATGAGVEDTLGVKVGRGEGDGNGVSVAKAVGEGPGVSVGGGLGCSAVGVTLGSPDGGLVGNGVAEGKCAAVGVGVSGTSGVAVATGVSVTGMTLMVNWAVFSPPSLRAIRVYTVVVAGETILLPGATTPSSVFSYRR